MEDNTQLLRLTLSIMVDVDKSKLDQPLCLENIYTMLDQVRIMHDGKSIGKIFDNCQPKLIEEEFMNNKRFKITVCKDGFVSIFEKPSERRLKAGLPVWSTDTIDEAFTLINMVCSLSRCHHPGKTGILLEPKAPDWPVEASYKDIEKLTKLFESVEKSICAYN